MIEKIIARNYQSHKKTVLDFDKGVNAIIGSSDVGKSALIRCLRWLAWNRPAGDRMRSHWGGNTVVTVKSNGHLIKRKRGKETCYVLDDTTFKATRADVPQQIKDTLNINEINLQRQFDRPFLLDSSAGDVALHFNKVAHLDSIDIASKRLLSWTKDLERSIRNDKLSLKDQKEQLQHFSNLNELDGRLAAIEASYQQVIQLNINVKKLQRLITDWHTTEEAIQQHHQLLDIAQAIKSISDDYKREDKLQKQIDELNIGIGMWAANEQNLVRAEQRYERLHTKFEKSMVGKCPLCGRG